MGNNAHFGDGNREIYVMNADGSNQIKITSSASAHAANYPAYYLPTNSNLTSGTLYGGMAQISRKYCGD